MKTLAQHDPWQALRRHTAARIAIGRSGASLPTREVLAFGVAHAQARDAVHLPFDAAALHIELSALGVTPLHVTSQAANRDSYLKRPDLGRLLSADSEKALQDAAARQGADPDVVFVIADGLSSLAVARHAVPLLQATLPLLSGWSVGPVVLAEQARVALGDPVALALRARAVVVLIGERPGLSSADSLGAYLTFAPRSGLFDADRNCISIIRPEGLPCADAACKLAYLLAGARRLGRSGIALKDDSDRPSDLPSPITTSIPPGEPA